MLDILETGLRVENLSKKYTKTPVVDDVSFVVKPGICFGLLGANGAGKTTTVEMIAALRQRDNGTIKVNNKNLEKRQNRIVGHCSQENRLLGFMTAYETLVYFGKMLGLSNESISKDINFLLNKLDLAPYRDIQVQYFSGGTKRKLCVAIAVVSFEKSI